MIRLGYMLGDSDAIDPSTLAAALVDADLKGVELHFDDVEKLTERVPPILEAGIELIGIAAELKMPGKLGGGSAWLDPVRRWVMTAAEVGCPQVRLSLPRATHRPAIARLADQLGMIGELADEVSIRLLIDAAGQFESAADLWRLLELVESSNLAASLPMIVDAPLITGGADEVADQNTVAHRPMTDRRQTARSAAVAIPLLNTRIHHASVKCAAPIATPPRWLANAVHHLLGVGYAGWLTIETSRESLKTCAAALQSLTMNPVAGKK